MTGLTSEQVRQLTGQGHANIQMDRSAKTTKDIFKENILTYFNLIFLILAVLLIIAGAFNSLTFLPVIIANTMIGIVQELHAKKVLDKLSILNEPAATAVRDGKRVRVPIAELVLNDLIVLKSGSQIPADARVESGEVSVNESLLTGESDEISKKPGDELMSGSFVTSGECAARLIRVGEDSYISKLMIRAKRMKKGEQSEMVRSINRIVMAAGIAIIPIGVSLFIQSFVMQGNTFSASITSMVAAVIGMIPEGLYLLVSVALAVASVQLASKKVMLHDMKSIETLARVNVLCVDKTGTITDGNMRVADVVPASEMSEDDRRRYEILAGEYVNSLSDDNITMKALREYFQGGGRQSVSAFPFSSRYKYSSVQFTDATYVLGAPEFILGKKYVQYKEKVDSYAKKGLRVMTFAQFLGFNGEGGGSLPVPAGGLEGADVNPIFFVLLENPIRENAKETFSYFAEQGVQIKVISGDNPVTVSEVARQAGIAGADRFVDASQLQTDEMIDKAAGKYAVFGRVTPDQKQKLVRALQRQGDTVAMTGDGVNDILAMKNADCSIAMAAGSDAAVQAAQVVLLDSDFSHMPQIVGQGRKTINNIERSATLFLVKNIFSFLLSVFSIINLLTYPLRPSQISLISMFNIGIPAFFLALEPNNERVQGRFLRRVIMRAMPAALTDFFAIAALVVFGNTFNVSSEDISVAATFLLAIVGFMILFRISSPMNRYHALIMTGCIIGLFVMAYYFNDLFDIKVPSTRCAMLFVLFAIATEPCMRYLSKLFELIDSKIALFDHKRSVRKAQAGAR